MRFYILLFLFTATTIMSAYGQIFTGVGSVSLNQKDLSLTSTQLVGRYTPDQHLISFMVKTQSLLFDASDSEKTFLREVMLMDVNPLMSLEFDMKAFPEIAADTDFPAKTLDIPLTLRYNDRAVSIKIPVSLEKQGASLTFSAHTDVLLSDLAIYLSGEEKNKYDFPLSIVVNPTVLTRR
ncbi:MAG: hypothetical protein SF052_12860 [Bacteroidia bacterium]|nr:hypothetical protein [Bacteroidia bacterium]